MMGKNLPKYYHVILLMVILVVLLASSLSGCSSKGSVEEKHTFSMADMSQMPPDVQKAPVQVQQAYQFAAANPEVLKGIPCYCGCGAMGHTSNYACYISGADAQGALIFDQHALGCSICIDISHDAMRLLDQGKTVPEIKAYIDQTYAKYGPSNMP